MRIEVEPDALIDAGKQIGSLGAQLDALSDAVGQIVSTGIASGTDPAGLNFGLLYGDQAQEFAHAVAEAANAFKSVGYMLVATGHNYKNADTSSTVGGSGATGSAGDPPAETKAADAATGPDGTSVPPPTKWHLIVPFLNVIPGGMFASAALTWPGGSPGRLRLAARQWENIGQGLSIFDDLLNPPRTVVGQQRIPEGDRIGQALDSLGGSVSKLSDSAGILAKQIDDFAKGVEETQNAIRRLLDRISLGGAWDVVKGIFTGEADDILREVANDVGTVLNNFQDQVKGIVGLLGQLTSAIGDAVTSLQEWVRPHLVELLGDDVGNALADVFTLYTDFQVGLTTGLINTVASTVALADPDTWKGMADVALSVARDPSKAPEVLANMGKEFVAWDKWSGDHPGRAAGEAAFNIGSLFVPGGALSKTGTLAKGLRTTRGLLNDGKIPGLRGLGSGNGAPNLDNVPDLESVPSGVPNVPEVRPPGIPESVLNPTAPHGVDGPSTPRGLEGPAGPPNPPGPAATPGGGGDGPTARGGGDGPPPTPPGTSTSPADSGPGRTDGPPSQPPVSGNSPGPTHPVDSPASSSAPSPTAAPDQPAAPHTPEASSPAAPHDAPSHAPSTHESQAPQANHAPTGGSHSDAGTAPPANMHAGDHAPSQNGSSAGEYNGRADAPTHAPPADQHNGQDRPVADSNPQAAQTKTSSDGYAGRQDAGNGSAPPPVGMAGVGPMTAHAPGATHAPSGTHTPDAPARTPDTRGPEARSPETRAPQTGTPESPRAQHPSAAGPTHTPTAPVNPAATTHTSGAGNQPTPTRPEPPSPRPDIDRRDAPPPWHSTPHDMPNAAPNDRPGSQPDQTNPNDNAGGGQGQAQRSPLSGNPADARTYGPHELRPVEDPAYQSAVEDALRDSDGNFVRHADPRLNDYGSLVNDGGPTVQGRSNNCLDCSLSALSSFRGDPTVSAPRFPDRLPDGEIDRNSGEQSGLRRAADWIGREMLEFPGRSVADQFEALHQYVDNLGPGSAALVHNGWHARDLDTGELLYHPDGSPVTNGSHATVVVYPEGAAGPVWWDPQQGITSDHPPAWMTKESSFLHFTPIGPDQGAHHGGTGDQGTSSGVSGGDVTDRDVSGSAVPARVGVHEDLVPAADGVGRGGGSSEAGDRFGDRDRVRVPELVGNDGGGRTHDVQGDGGQPSGPSDLSASVAHNDSPDPGGPGADRVSDDSGIADRSSGAEPRASVDDRQAHVPLQSDGLVVERGDVARGVDEPAEPGGVAGGGHDRGVGDAHGEHPSAPRDGAAQTLNPPKDEPTLSRSEGDTPDARHHSDDAEEHPERTAEGDPAPDPVDSHEWDGTAGEHAARLLPADDSGYRIEPRDCEFLGISPDQVEAWANCEAPLGMTRSEFIEFRSDLFDALARDGLNADDLDIRLQGSSARFFSGEHKTLPLESDLPDHSLARTRMANWFGDDENRPLRRPFDSMHRLGLDDEPSDYDIQVSSDRMVDACRERWEADGAKGDLVHPKYGFISKKIFGDMFPELWEWAEHWTERTGREVVPALFGSAGPPDTSASGVSSHFRDSDWRIQLEDKEPS